MDFEKFAQIWQESTPVPEPLTYRLYYDDQDGAPLFYSMERLPGTYIEIDQATFQRNSSRVRVVNGQLVQLLQGSSSKLVPDSDGTPCHPGDVCIVVSSDDTNVKWRKKGYTYGFN